MKFKIATLLGASLLLAACGTLGGPAAPRTAAHLGAYSAAPVASSAPSEAPSAAPSVAPDPAPAFKPRPYTLEQMGVGKRVVANLAKQGIYHSLQLLDAAATPAGRDKLLEATGMSPEKLFELLHMADLMRIKGIGPTQSRLLISAGVTTVKDLARRNPVFLQTTLDVVNGEDRVSERTPSTEVVAAWIESAKALERVVRY